MTLATRSVEKLVGVHPDLVRVVEAAHGTCKFHVTDGVRSLARQKELVITLHANSFMEMFGKDDVSLTYGVAAGTAASAGAALEIVASKAVLSGCHWHREDPSINPQATQYGAAVARDGFLQVGAGLYTTLNFPVPALLDQTAARKWVAPGCIG